MDDVKRLIHSLATRGISLWLEHGELRYGAAKGVLSAQLMASLRERRSEIVRALHADTAAPNTLPPIIRIPRNGRLPLSSAQERLWFLEMLGLVGTAYNIVRALRLESALDYKVLERSFEELVRRHEILRTRFDAVGGVAFQIIDHPVAFRLGLTDLSTLEPAAREESVQEAVRQLSLHRFDLAQGPLFRVSLLKFAQQENVLLLAVHHILFDAWSMELLLNEMNLLYEAFLSNRASPLHELDLQYADYASWQRGLQEEALRAHLEYWRRHLEGAPLVLELPTDRARPAIASVNGGVLGFVVPTEFVDALERLCRQEKATLFMVLLAAFQLLLSRWSGQTDIVVGAPITGRALRPTQSMLGLFLNTLPLRTQVSEHASFRELLGRVKRVTLDALRHQDLPLERLVMELQPGRDLSSQPLAQVAFTLVTPMKRTEEQHLLHWEEIPVEQTTAKFDLMLYMSHSAHGLHGSFEFATDLFERSTIERLARYYVTLLTGIVADPDRPVHTLPLMTESERHRLVVEWNATDSTFPQKCVHELFAEQAQRTPDALALVYEDQRMTYAELNKKANQLARYLRARGLGSEQRVAICLERGIEIVVGLLGVLKAGGAYVPLDPSYPSERLARMLKDAAPEVLLTQKRLQGVLPPTSVATIALDSDWREINAQEATDLDADLLRLTSRNLAYVIYTSGSTGDPKGVMVEHSGVVNLLSSMQKSPGIGAADCLLSLTTVAFDMVIPEIYLPLINGARLVLAPREAAVDARKLIAMMDQFDVTILQAAPATWQLLLNAGWEGKPTLKGWCGAEALTAELSRELAKRLGTLWNLYGPTETTVWSCRRHIAEAAEPGTVESIGQPIANTQVYILDRHLQPVPIGVAGEIYIAGAGVARGYLNRSGLTAERFIADPFSQTSQMRLYKTGDLGRWGRDGNLEYLGRNDHQVKIRGFRVELGEVEAHLMRHGQVRDAVVIAREDVPGDKRLAAYLIPSNPSSTGVFPSASDLRAFLKARLPDYMVPSAFVVLEHFPLTPNGKLNRRALPAPEPGAYASRQYEAPQGDTELALAAIWQEVLRVESIARDDNFFDLGGHSLLSMKLIAKVAERFTVQVPVIGIFQNPTIREMAKLVRRSLLKSLRLDNRSFRTEDPIEFEEGAI